MNTERSLMALSYAAVFCGFLSLWTSGAFGVVGGLFFIALMAIAWLIEGTRFQLSERVGTVLILLAIPVFYILWRTAVNTCPTDTFAIGNKTFAEKI
jgi:hypothetical protein